MFRPETRYPGFVPPRDRLDLRRRLTAIAATQSGYFTAAQALEAGYSYPAQKYNADRGSWEKVDRGIYRLPEWPVGPHDDLVRWSLWSRGKAVVSHDTALSVYELGDVNPARVHLTVPPNFRPTAHGVVLHRATLPAEDIRSHEGYRITAPLRSLLDVAAEALQLDLLAGAIREALDRGLVTQRELVRRADEFGARAALQIERASGGAILMQYASPAALRQALDDRLRNEAENRRVDIQRLRRRAVFERMLVRLERVAAGRWVLKGGMALELRLGDRARATKDLDLVVRETSREAAEVRDLLIEALAKDPDGDGFEFRVGEATALDVDQAGRPGWRFPIEADLAGRLFARVRTDVVARSEEINATERLRLPGLLAFAGIEVGDVEAVDRAQHFAEKLHALTRTYRGDRPSTRVKDLPDLILLIDDGLEPGAEVLEATERVFDSRATHALPAELPDPPTAWEPAYALLAEELDISAASLGEAMSLLRSFWTRAVASRKEER